MTLYWWSNPISLVLHLGDEDGQPMVITVSARRWGRAQEHQVRVQTEIRNRIWAHQNIKRKECWKCEEKTHKNHRASACCDVDSVNWKAELSLTKMTFGCQEDDIPMRVASYTWRLFLCTVVHLEAPFSTLSISLPMGSDNAFARKKPTRWRVANMANICTIITIEFHLTTLWAPSMAWGALSRGFWLLI